MELYRQPVRDTFSISHIIWPLLAVLLGLLLYKYLLLQTPAVFVHNFTPTSTADNFTSARMVTANVLAAFEESARILESVATTSESESGDVPRIAELSKPVLVPTQNVKKLTTTTRTFKSVTIPKFIAPVTIEPVPARASQNISATSTVATNIVHATSSAIPQLFEVKVPGGGGGKRTR